MFIAVVLALMLDTWPVLAVIAGVMVLLYRKYLG